MKFVATDRVLIFSAVICTCLTLPTIPQRTEGVTGRHAKRVKRSSISDLATLMLEFGDVDGDGLLTEAEMFLFFKHGIGFSDTEAYDVSKEMILLGDFTGDRKLDYLEAAVAVMAVTDLWENGNVVQ
ncbi:uncharacterized protein [Argopecten irradians]|uniref:uncharacterized protein n=1 Tax=Argopecten irradians TaxID=31199 RepID=UPI003716E262